MLGYSRAMHKIASSLLLLSSLVAGTATVRAQSPSARPVPLLQPAPARIAPPDPALRAAFDAAAGNSGLDDLALAGFSGQPLAAWLEYVALRGRMDTLPLARGNAFLVAHRGRVFTREALLNQVWGYDYYGGTRTVDVHIRRIRAKLGPDHEDLVETIRNVGYRFNV